jgi:pimeloyl-ACP methyl ester carboxylesterase
VQRLALDHPARVRSLVLISISPATSGDRHRKFPPAAEEFARSVTSTNAGWSDADAVAEYLVDYSRAPARIPCWASQPPWPGSLGAGARMTFGKGYRNVVHWSALASPRPTVPGSCQLTPKLCRA